MCDCADETDKFLKHHNTRLTRAMVLGEPRPDNPNLLLRTEQIETGRGKKKAVSMFISFCPFCGTQYEAS